MSAKVHDVAPPSEAQSPLAEAKVIARLALPIALSQVGMILLHVVDTAILGKQSPAALEAGSLGRNVIFALNSLGVGIALTLESIASQAVAAGEHDRAWGALKRVLRTTALVWPFSAALSVLLVLGLPRVPGFHISKEAADGAFLFILVNVPSLLFYGFYVAARTFLQAHGRTLPTLVASIVANALNWFVCNLLVRGDAFLVSMHFTPMGVRPLGPLGAGLSGTLSALVMCVWVLVAARKHRAIGASAVPAVSKILKMGASVGVQILAEVGAFALAGVLSVHFGQTDSGAFQIALQLASLTFMGALGVSGATAVRVGHAVGLRQRARLPGLLGIIMGASVMTIGAVLFTLSPRVLVSQFTSDPSVLAAGVTLLHVAAVFQVFDGVQVVAGGALRGAGDVRFASYCTIFAHWCVGIPAALVFAFGFHLGALGLWCGLTLGLITAATTTSARFVRISKRVIERV